MRSKNKADWGPGPWLDEPDERDWIDPTTMLNCRILRGPFGAFCGYVGIPKNHPAYGMGYNPYVGDYVDENVEWWRRHITHRVEYKIKDIYVHGGLTYAGNHIDSDLHWFGFDCSHAEIVQYIHTAGEIYRDISYVTKEVESLAKQLAAIKEEPYAEESTS